MVDKLVFDTTSVDTIADSSSVGAFLRASDGTLLTHTDVGGKKALDVHVTDGINVEVDLSYVDDSVTAHQGGTWTIDSITNPVAVTDNGGSITVDGSVTVSATDLDIRDLAFASDSVTAHQGGTWNIGTVSTITNVVHVDDNGGSITVDGAVTVSATDLDIRDLSAATDSVSAYLKDGSGNSITSTGGSLNVNMTNTLTVNDAALANVAMAHSANTLDVAATAESVVASALANRKYLMLYNKGNRVMYVGGSGVTSSNGFPVSPGAYLEMRLGAAQDVKYVADDLGHEIRVLELS